VGQKKPNAWGLYDMHGNVLEACSDAWDQDFYRTSPAEDPVGRRPHGFFGVLRGGCWYSGKNNLDSFTCAFRQVIPSDGREPSFCLGFRVARTVTP